MTEEHMIRVARWPDSVEFPIYTLDPVKPIPACWLVLSEVLEQDQDDEYCLYVLDVQGYIHECLQFETLRIALDQSRFGFRLGEPDWGVPTSRAIVGAVRYRGARASDGWSPTRAEVALRRYSADRGTAREGAVSK